MKYRAGPGTATTVAASIFSLAELISVVKSAEPDVEYIERLQHAWVSTDISYDPVADDIVAAPQLQPSAEPYMYRSAAATQVAPPGASITKFLSLTDVQDEVSSASEAESHDDNRHVHWPAVVVGAAAAFAAGFMTSTTCRRKRNK